MRSIEFAIGSSNIIDIVMEMSMRGIYDTVVTAHDIPRDMNSLGYTIQTIKGDDINDIKWDNLISSLAGKIAGLTIKNTGNVLNSAAACTLYGSSGSNGVILITTKKGSNELKSGKTFGVKLNSNVTLGTIDKSTFPKYQKDYGAGYGMNWYGDTTNGSEHPGLEYFYDVNGDGEIDYTVPFSDDASRGEKFNPDLLVYQFDAAEPASANYMNKTPWIAAVNGPEYFFQNSVNYTNSIALNGNINNFNFRLSCTNMNKTGILPNSLLKRNNLAFRGEYIIFNNVKVSGQIAYVTSDVKGRNATGYSDNILTSFRQWYQVNVDMKTLENLYKETNRNITWNRSSFYDPTPAYWDNPYWVSYQNFETDHRNHLICAAHIDYTITRGLSLLGGISIDTYNELQEERKAIGSVEGEFGVGNQDVTSGYSKFTRDFKETNIDFIATYKKEFANKFSIHANIGFDNHKNSFEDFFISTNGGLAIPNLYVISNSKYANLSFQESKINYNSKRLFGLTSIDYNGFLFLDGTYSNEIMSTLANNKIGASSFSVSNSLLLSKFFNSDYLTLYKTNTNNQLLNVSTSINSGFWSKWVNAGEIENKGIELMINATPVKNINLAWDLNLNWAKNKSLVKSLAEGLDNLQRFKIQLLN